MATAFPKERKAKADRATPTVSCSLRSIGSEAPPRPRCLGLRAVRAANSKGWDRTWFPRWMKSYAVFCARVKAPPLPLEEKRIISFLQSVKARGKPAWQRLQAARAICNVAGWRLDN